MPVCVKKERNDQASADQGFSTAMTNTFVLLCSVSLVWPLDHEQLGQTMHTIPPNVHRANVMHVQYNVSIVTAYMDQLPVISG